MRAPKLLPHVHASLAALRAECPEAYRRLCTAVGRRTAHLQVDGEVISLRGTGDALTASEDPGEGGPAGVAVAASGRTLLGLIDGRLSLEGALLSGRLEARGAVGDLAAFHEALRWYVAGGARAPSFERLAERFREDLEGSDGG